MKYGKSNVQFALLTVLLLLFTPSLSAGWETDLENLLTAETYSSEQIRDISVQVTDWKAVYAFLMDRTFTPPMEAGACIEMNTACRDGVERPFVLCVPKSYDGTHATPLLVVLHGGVGRTDIVEDRMQYVTEHPLYQLAQHRGWFALFPFGQAGAVWWDETGADMILREMKHLRSAYNIDENRTWMGGFSDGASGSYHFAMTQPDPFAAFVPLNGHMGVGSLDGDWELFAENMALTPLYAVNTDLDSLYPAATMRHTITMARTVGADIFYKEINGFGHDWGYLETDRDNIGRFLDTRVRNPIPHDFEWRTATPAFGHCRWLRIDAIDPETAAPWHTDTNLIMTGQRITFGFFPVEGDHTQGIPVEKVVEEDCFARRIGLVPGDIITRCNTTPIGSMADLSTFKKTIKRGDTLTVAINRDGKEMILKGAMAPPEHYYIFPRKQPSAAVRARFQANTFTLDTSRTAGFTLFIHPDMIQPDQNIRVICNDTLVFDNLIQPDISYMVENFLKHRDRQMIFIREIHITPVP